MFKILSTIARNRKHVLLACFPKSGSTYLAVLIEDLTNMKRVSLVTGFDRREQELSVEQLTRHNFKNYVSQHHVKCSKVTENLMSVYNIKPIVLVRNLYDVVVSLYDHFHNEGIISPLAYMPEEILNWDKNKTFEFIVDMLVPWYMNFFVSWSHYKDKLFLTYDDVVNEPQITLTKITSFLDMKQDQAMIDLSIKNASKKNTRKNIGKAGRGNDLPEHIKNKINKIAEYYPNVDFSSIGIIHL